MYDVAPSVNPTCDCVHSITVIQNVNKAQVKVRAKKDNVAGKFVKRSHHLWWDRVLNVYFLSSGVTLPVFEHYQEGGDSKSHLDKIMFDTSSVLWSVNDSCESRSSLCLLGYELTGLAKGGEQISRLKRNYARAVELLVELASLQVEGNIQIYWGPFITLGHSLCPSSWLHCKTHIFFAFSIFFTLTNIHSYISIRLSS